MSEVRRERDHYTDGTHGMPAGLTDHQIRVLLDEADGGWGEFYRRVLAHRKREAEGGDCGSPCTCADFEEKEAQR